MWADKETKDEIILSVLYHLTKASPTGFLCHCGISFSSHAGHRLSEEPLKALRE